MNGFFSQRIIASENAMLEATQAEEAARSLVATLLDDGAAYEEVVEELIELITSAAYENSKLRQQLLVRPIATN